MAAITDFLKKIILTKAVNQEKALVRLRVETETFPLKGGEYLNFSGLSNNRQCLSY